LTHAKVQSLLYLLQRQRRSALPDLLTLQLFTYLADAEKRETMIKYTTQFLLKIEEMIGESDYMLRYEKGNFKSGYCVLKDQKIMIVNKFYTTEGKINALLDILKGTELDTSKFSEKSQKLFDELVQTPTPVNN
jgi:hypothetical protein